MLCRYASASVARAWAAASRARSESISALFLPTTSRTRVWIELLGCMLFLVPYCFVILEYGIEFALRSYAMGEKSAAQTGLEHRFIIKAFLPLGFTFLALAGMSVALKCLVYLFGPDWLRDRSSYYAGTGHDGAPDDAAPASN